MPEEALKVRAGDHERRRVDQRMAAQRVVPPGVRVDHELDGVLRVGDERERGHRSRRDLQVLGEPLRRAEAQVVGADDGGERPQVDGLTAQRHHQPVPAALLVAQEQILGVRSTAEVGDGARRFFARVHGIVVVPRVADAQLREQGIDVGGRGRLRVGVHDLRWMVAACGASWRLVTALAMTPRRE